MTTLALTGATGQLGRLVIAELLSRGVVPADLVAIVRDATKAQALVDAGLQVRVADYDDPTTLRAALGGVDRLLLISGNAFGQRVAQHRNVIEAAQATRVRHLTYTSLLRADTNTMPLAEEHHITEQLLKDSGIPTIVLRNGWYVENYTDQLDTYRRVGAIVGAGGTARVAPAPRAAYPAAAASALLADSITPAVYELAGPSASLPELAATLSKVTGQDLPYRAVSLDEYRSGLIEAGLDEDTAAFYTGLEAGTAAGELDGTTIDLERLLGRTPTDLHTSISNSIN